MDNFCRLCRRTGEFESVSIQDMSRNHGELIASIIENCLPLQIAPSDGLPQRICNMCQAQLEMFYVLRKISFSSDCYFKEILQQDEELRSPIPNIEVEVQLNQDYGCSFNSSADQSHQFNESDIKTEPLELSDEAPSYNSSYECSYEPKHDQSSSVPLRDFGWTHKTEEHKQEEKPKGRYTCSDCGYSSPYKANVFRHIKLLGHSGLQDMVPGRKLRPSLDEILASSNASKMKIYMCETCGYRSTFKGNVERHQRSHRHGGIDVSIYGKNKTRIGGGSGQPATSNHHNVGQYRQIPSPTSQQAMIAQQEAANKAEQDLMQEIRDEFMKIGANAGGMEGFDQQQQNAQ